MVQPLNVLCRCSWFKGYFSWVNNAPCEHCGSTNTTNAGGDRANAAEKAYGAGVVELYKCSECSKMTRFPRFNHPGKLMDTRRGRCGEWANAFTLCCIAMGFEARHTVDWTDHVWTEVFSEDQQRWVHCDPCENAWVRRAHVVCCRAPLSCAVCCNHGAALAASGSVAPECLQRMFVCLLP